MAEKKQEASGGAAACADGGCRLFGSSTPMCSRCYAEKVVKPAEELEVALAEIRRVSGSSGKAAAAPSGGAAVVCRKKVGVRNCS
ncbi:hypothetical protein ACP70R_047432 [Stipagrostis hirtigluma subsp. patula]